MVCVCVCVCVLSVQCNTEHMACVGGECGADLLAAFGNVVLKIIALL